MSKENRNILIVCAHQQIGETLIRIIKDRSLGLPQLVNDAGAALLHLANHPCEIVLIGSGLEDEKVLCNQINKLYPQVKLVWHYGGGSGLINVELA